MDRFGDKIICNPTVKLEKGNQYSVINIDKINPGYKYVTSDEMLEFTGQSGCRFEDNDVLMARITPCLENGKLAVAKDIGGKGIGSTELFVFRGIEGLTDTNYIYYLLSLKYMRQLAANSMTGASGRQRADLGFIKKIPWTYPTIEVQRKIVECLSTYDELIENNISRIKLLEQMAENLYKEWFVRFRFPGHEDVEFENGLPKGWESKKLSEVFEVKYGKDHKNIEDGDIPILGSGGVMRYGNKALYSGESVLIPRKGSLNNVMYMNEAFWTVDTMFYTKLIIENIGKYAFYTLNSMELASYNSGAALPSMTTDILYHLKIVVPTQGVLIKFNEIVDSLYKKKKQLSDINENLIKQRDLLLPRLMSGKLEVK